MKLSNFIKLTSVNFELISFRIVNLMYLNEKILCSIFAFQNEDVIQI